MKKSIYILLVLILVSLLLIFCAARGYPATSSARGRSTSDTLLISDIHDGGKKGWGQSEDDTRSRANARGCAGGSAAAIDFVVSEFKNQGGRYIIFGGDSLTHDSESATAMIDSTREHLEIFSKYVDLANVIYANGNHDGAMNGKAFFGCKDESDSKRWADLLIEKGVVSNIVGGNTDTFRKTGYYMKNIPYGSNIYVANFNSVLLRAPSWDGGHALTKDCKSAEYWDEAVDSPNAPDMIDRLYSDLQSLPSGSEVYIVTHYPYFGRGDGTGHSTDRTSRRGGPNEFFDLTTTNGKKISDFSNKIKGFLTAHTHKRLVVGEKDGKRWLNMPAFHPNNWGCCAKNSDCGTIDDARTCLEKNATDYCTCEDEAAQPAFAYANIKDIFQTKDMYLKC
jgi:metallophosphoesterase superfamily enzyme